VAPGAVLWREHPMLSAEVRHFFHVQDKLRLAMSALNRNIAKVGERKYNFFVHEALCLRRLL
jgi:hypothetical protein